jgi:hypothetical protein
MQYMPKCYVQIFNLYMQHYFTSRGEKYKSCLFSANWSMCLVSFSFQLSQNIYASKYNSHARISNEKPITCFLLSFIGVYNVSDWCTSYFYKSYKSKITNSIPTH